jgi:hypothetical protein
MIYSPQTCKERKQNICFVAYGKTLLSDGSIEDYLKAVDIN